MNILDEIGRERMLQDEKWGEQNHADGTGRYNQCWPSTNVDSQTYGKLAEAAKNTTDQRAAAGIVTFADILLEEVFEALAEEDQDKLRVELIQVAAVATQWAQKIDRDKARG